METASFFFRGSLEPKSWDGATLLTAFHHHFRSEDTDFDLMISGAGNDGIPCDCSLKATFLNCWTGLNLPNG